MKAIRTAEYEVIARQRARLSDGWGWTGIYRAAYSINKTVIGFRRNFVFIPVVFGNGAAGSSGERASSRITNRAAIEYEANLRDACV